MQKRLLVSLQSQFTDKLNKNMVTRCFNVLYVGYKQSKERKEKETQGA